MSSEEEKKQAAACKTDRPFSVESLVSPPYQKNFGASNSTNQNNPVNSAQFNNCTFNIDVKLVVEKYKNEFDIMDEVKLRRMVFLAKNFYEENKSNSCYGINKKTYFLWNRKPYVGGKFRDFISKAPLICVLTQIVNERKELKAIYRLKNQNGNDYINSLLNLSLDDNKKKFDEDYLDFVETCHLKRFGFLKYYFKTIFSGLNYLQIVSELKEYPDVVNVYNKIKNSDY